MVSCALRSCRSSDVIDKKINSGITFHRFPKDLPRREIWVKFVARSFWKPSKYSALCSKHFDEKYMDRTSLCCVRLRSGAVPTLYPQVVYRILIGSYLFGMCSEQ